MGPLLLFLKCLAAPEQLSPLILNAVIAPCFGCKLLGDLDALDDLDTPDDTGTHSGDHTAAGSCPTSDPTLPPKEQQFDAAAVFDTLQDCALLSALRAAYDATPLTASSDAQHNVGRIAGDAGRFAKFCEWVESLIMTQ